MAAIDFKTLTIEEVAGLTGKNKKAYEKWLENQRGDSSNENGQELIEVESLIDGLNTTLYGNFRVGDRKQIGIKIAVQLEVQGSVKCYPNEDNQEAYDEELEKIIA